MGKDIKETIEEIIIKIESKEIQDSKGLCLWYLKEFGIHTLTMGARYLESVGYEMTITKINQ